MIEDRFFKGLSMIEERLSYRFKNPLLLKKALTHTSYANERVADGVESNEKFEFLGDAIIDMVASIILMERFPDFDEGELSKFRARVVSEIPLARIAESLGLGDAVLLGKGEEKSGGRKKPSILSSTFEAVVAALYMDGGFEKTFRAISALLSERIDDIWRKGAYLDYKTLLQELCQRVFKDLPVYQLVDEEGPEHSKLFKVEVRIKGEIYGHGTGRSKKEAEKDAARKALERLKDV